MLKERNAEYGLLHLKHTVPSTFEPLYRLNVPCLTPHTPLPIHQHVLMYLTTLNPLKEENIRIFGLC